MRRIVVGAVLVLMVAGCSASGKSASASKTTSGGSNGAGSSMPKCSKWFSEGADPSTYAASSECIDAHGAVAEYQLRTVNCFDHTKLTWTTVGWWNQTNKFHVFKSGEQQPPTLTACGA